MISDEQFPTLCEYGALDEVLIQYLETNPKVKTYKVGRVMVVDTLPVTKPSTEEEKVPTIYTVAQGDFLRKIAKNLLGAESEWKKLYEWNKDIIKNPNFISIGQELLILD
jgi:nucleoid-associated protein YgaU